MSADNAAPVNNPFGSSEVVTRPTGALAAAAAQREMAEVQAAMIIAKANPRDPIQAMDLILQDCARPTLAEQALYNYSRGGSDITGPSIRLAETIARRWGNIECGVKELSRHNGYSECLAYAIDLETNFRDAKTFQVKHWRDTKKGGYAITDERDIYETIANNGARRKRACLLSVIPGDVVEAATDQCYLTMKTKIEITPEFLKKLLEVFERHGVTQAMIEKRIQRRLDAMTPVLAIDLKKIHNSLKDGMSKVSDWFESEVTDSQVDGKHGGTFDTLKERMRAKKEQSQEAKGAHASKGAPTEGLAPDAIFAIVAERLNKAAAEGNLDVLDVAGDYIAGVEDEKQRAELQELFKTLREKFTSK